MSLFAPNSIVSKALVFLISAPTYNDLFTFTWLLINKAYNFLSLTYGLSNSQGNTWGDIVPPLALCRMS